LGDRKGTRPVKNRVVRAGLVVCLEQGTDLYMAQLMPLPLTVSCFSKIQIGFTFLVLAHLGSSGKRVVKWVLVYYSSIKNRKKNRNTVCKTILILSADNSNYQSFFSVIIAVK